MTTTPARMCSAPETRPSIRGRFTSCLSASVWNCLTAMWGTYFLAAACARGIVCELPPIDSGYRGEVHAIVSNVGGDGYDIKKGDRIGQLVIMPVVIPEFTYAESAERGTGAFGSSGR